MQDNLLKSRMRENRTYGSVRGVEINVYSTKALKTTFLKVIMDRNPHFVNML